MRLSFLSAIAVTALAAGAHAADHVTVQMAFYPQGPQAYLFLADQKGWFKDAGLDVEIADGRGSNYAMQIVSSGHADIGEGMLSPIGPARERGATAKAIAEWYKDGPAIVAGVDSGISTPKDLKGKKVGIIASGIWPPLLDSFLGRFGLTQDDVHLVYLDSTALFAAYARKDIDAMLTVDLAVTEANPLRPSRLLPVSDDGVKLPGDGLFATDATISARADMLKRFIGVCARSLAYIANGHEDEAANAIKAERPMGKISVKMLISQIKLFDTMRFDTATQGKPLGWQSPQDWADRVAYMKSIGMISGHEQPADYFTNAFIPTGG